MIIEELSAGGGALHSLTDTWAGKCGAGRRRAALLDHLFSAASDLDKGTECVQMKRPRFPPRAESTLGRGSAPALSPGRGDIGNQSYRSCAKAKSSLFPQLRS